MSTLTMPRPAAAKERVRASSPGFFARLWAAIIAAQQHKAQAYVRSYLAELPATRLAEMGYGPHEIAQIKAEDLPPTGRWN